MITSSVARFARTATIQSPLSSACITTSALSQQLSIRTRKLHQRRNSSSKASIPPNGSSRGRAAAPSASTASSPASRIRRKAKIPQVHSAFALLPSVPSTAHLLPEGKRALFKELCCGHANTETDVSVSSFFSLHRPMSVTTAIPPATTQESFAQLFDFKSSYLKYEPLEVIKTLGHAVQDLDGSNQDGHLEEAGLFSQGERTPTRAGIPRDVPHGRSGDFRPFMAPPVPEPQTDASMKRAKRVSKKEDGTKRTWTAKIRVTEHISASGERHYSAETQEPMVESVVEEPTVGSKMQQPFLHRMRIRQQRWRQEQQTKMEAISVKRQRKLKMKKHKYKKLMKRTRNERRRLGKL